ncbi:hypothetical protein [Brevundimonas diminuta]|uniref:hypothetical protein n=1 Tax=Brevundimonas diminuta TaxID=293 RepID=UPI003D9A6FA9
MSASILALALFGLVSIAVLGVLSEIRGLRARVMLLEAVQDNALKQRPDPAKRTVEISRPDSMAWYLARAGWSPAEIADHLNLPLAQVEGWTRDGRADV